MAQIKNKYGITFKGGKEIEDLKLKKLKLLNKAFKMIPNSPKQLKIREEIADLDAIK